MLQVRASETWAAGWFGVALWGVISVVVAAGGDLAILGARPVVWACLAVSAAHFTSSYALAYGREARTGRDGLSAHPFALVWGPIIMILAGVGIVAAAARGHEAAESAVRAGITGVLIMTIWHAIKQVYGVGRLGAALDGIHLGSREVTILRFGLYPLWITAAVALFGPNGHASIAGRSIGATILPAWVVSASRGIAVASVILMGVVLIGVCRRVRRVPGLLVAPYLAWSLWLLAPPATASLAIIPALHAIQYLVCVRRAEDASGQRSDGLVSRQSWWIEYVVGAAAIGLLLATWLPPILDRALGFGDADSTGMVVAVVFVGLNAHHYLIDAVVWRSGGRHVRAITGRSLPSVIGLGSET